MSGFSANVLKSLESQLSPVMVLALLFGVTVLLGMLLGGCIVGALSAYRTRRKLRAAAAHHDEMERLLVESRQHGVKLQAEQDKLRASRNGLDVKLSRRNDSLDEMKDELNAAKALVRQRDQENRVLKSAADRKDPPTLIKRVPAAKDSALYGSDTGIIPDDQVIPTLPEAELTANVDAYDLSDIEELGKQDG